MQSRRRRRHGIGGCMGGWARRNYVRFSRSAEVVTYFFSPLPFFASCISMKCFCEEWEKSIRSNVTMSRTQFFSLNWSQSSFRGTRALKSIFGRGTILGVPGGKNFGGRSPLPCCTQGQNRMEREEKRMGWEGDGRDVGLIAAQNLGPMALVQISLPSSLLSMGSVQMALHASIGETDARFSGSN